jgi:spore germination cell wall hydrolase CwlJ-like protein
MFKFTMVVVIMMAGAVQADPVQKHCLAEAMYFEARNQGWKGMLAVGVVIQNRVKDPRYPSDICSVVRQGKYWRGNPVKHKCQFSYYCDGKHERPAEKQAWKEASDIAGLLVATDLVVAGLEDATHYHCTTVKPSWATGLKKRKKVGDHVFYSAR